MLARAGVTDLQFLRGLARRPKSDWLESARQARHAYWKADGASAEPETEPPREPAPQAKRARPPPPEGAQSPEPVSSPPPAGAAAREENAK